MGQLTWAGGLVTLILSWAISYGTFIALVLMHEQKGVAADGHGEAVKIGAADGNADADAADADTDSTITRMDRYQELTRFAFGRKVGNWALLPFQVRNGERMESGERVRRPRPRPARAALHDRAALSSRRPWRPQPAVVGDTRARATNPLSFLTPSF